MGCVHCNYCSKFCRLQKISESQKWHHSPHLHLSTMEMWGMDLIALSNEGLFGRNSLYLLSILLSVFIFSESFFIYLRFQLMILKNYYWILSLWKYFIELILLSLPQVLSWAGILRLLYTMNPDGTGGTDLTISVSSCAGYSSSVMLCTVALTQRKN